jgi:hypothetical protein
MSCRQARCPGSPPLPVGLRQFLTDRIRTDVRFNVDYHEKSGLPGDGTMVVLLWLALNWLIMERLTLPDLLTDRQRRDLVTALVDRLLTGQPDQPVNPFHAHP